MEKCVRCGARISEARVKRKALYCSAECRLQAQIRRQLARQKDDPVFKEKHRVRVAEYRASHPEGVRESMRKHMEEKGKANIRPRRDAGLCTICPKPPKPALPGRALCDEHRRKNNEASRRFRKSDKYWAWWANRLGVDSADRDAIRAAMRKNQNAQRKKR